MELSGFGPYIYVPRDTADAFSKYRYGGNALCTYKGTYSPD